jgi:hypothetical protein
MSAPDPIGDSTLHHERGSVTARIFWGGLVAAVFMFFSLLAYWEPILGDGWGHFYIHRDRGLSWDSFTRFAYGSYTGGNPRLGQWFTLLTYTPGPWHAIMTPSVIVATFFALFALALGRWPRASSWHDVTLMTFLLAAGWLGVPIAGQIYGYRPYVTNYLYGALIQLVFLLPYRFALARACTGTGSRLRAWFGVLPMLALGTAAGMCNEHTGPTVILAAAGMIWFGFKQGSIIKPWGLGGLLGVIAGYGLLFFAPGQQRRYGNLAQESGLLERILERGLIENAWVLVKFGMWLSPLLLLTTLIFGIRCLAQRKKPSLADSINANHAWVVFWFFLAGLSMLCVLLASPKIGARLYLAPALCWIMASVVLISHWTGDFKTRRFTLVASLLILTVYAGLMVDRYYKYQREFKHRLALLSDAEPGSSVLVPAYTHARSGPLVFGDDFRSESFRKRAARAFKLESIAWE